MSKKIKFKLNGRAGVTELRKSTEMQAILNAKADEIQARCGDGYEKVSRMGYDRASAKVWAESYKARKDNSDNNTILKAVQG